MNQSTAHYELRVSEGRQAGARAMLHEAEPTEIGTDYGSDIVFTGGEKTPQRFKLHQDAHGLLLEMLEGEIHYADKTILPGDLQRIETDSPVQVGSTVFSLQSVAPAVPADPQQLGETEALTQRKPSRLMLLASSIAAIVVLATVAISDHQRSLSEPIAEIPPVAELLKDAGFDNVDYRVDEEGNASVVGFVDSRQNQLAVEDIVNMSTGNFTTFDIQVNDELAEAVRDIYRVHGVEAIVLVDGLGSVQVNTSVREVDQLEVIEGVVRTDIPLLSILESSNAVPAELTAEESLTIANDPDKRVTLVVAGDPAYVVTQDKSRYFVGSMLPTGHTIQEIDEGVVIVDKDGVQTNLEFN